jgi:hypothetical protein
MAKMWRRLPAVMRQQLSDEQLKMSRPARSHNIQCIPSFSIQLLNFLNAIMPLSPIGILISEKLHVTHVSNYPVN